MGFVFIDCWRAIGREIGGRACGLSGWGKFSGHGISGIDKRNDIMDGLFSYGIATKVQVDAVKNRPIKV